MDSILAFERSHEDDYYAILGCDELSSTEQIVAEYKARVLDCHPDKHPGDSEAAKRFELIQRSKDVLSGEKRSNYDKWRRAGIAMPYKEWCGMRDSVHTSLHWANPKKECMLEDQNRRETSRETFAKSPRERNEDLIHPVSQLTKPKVPWENETPSDMLRKFRNYEI